MRWKGPWLIALATGPWALVPTRAEGLPLLKKRSPQVEAMPLDKQKVRVRKHLKEIFDRSSMFRKVGSASEVPFVIGLNLEEAMTGKTSNVYVVHSAEMQDGGHCLGSDWNRTPIFKNLRQIPKVKDLTEPKTKVIVTSRNHGGSNSKVTLARLHGRDVVVKELIDPTPDDFRYEARMAQLNEEIKVSPRFHGIQTTKEGRKRLIWDAVAGDLDGPMTAQAFDDLEEILHRYETVTGAEALHDFQTMVTKSGRLLVIDPGLIGNTAMQKEIDALTPTQIRSNHLRRASTELGVAYLEKLRGRDPHAWELLIGHMKYWQQEVASNQLSADEWGFPRFADYLARRGGDIAPRDGRKRPFQRQRVSDLEAKLLGTSYLFEGLTKRR